MHLKLTCLWISFPLSNIEPSFEWHLEASFHKCLGRFVWSIMWRRDNVEVHEAREDLFKLSTLVLKDLFGGIVPVNA